MSLNLSKTEFITYLECPFKFYLMQDLHQNKNHGPRGKRDYSEFSENLQLGMKWHRWLQYFHINYEQDIISGSCPFDESSDEDVLKKHFFKIELERYNMNPKQWHPFVVEQYLESTKLRGIIDRIDIVGSDSNCRIVEYKSKPREFDKEEMLFYSLLFLKAKNSLEYLPAKSQLQEFAFYYYKLGEWSIESIKEEVIFEFEKKYNSIIEEINNPNWKKRKKCNKKSTNCFFKHICQLISI